MGTGYTKQITTSARCRCVFDLFASKSRRAAIALEQFQQQRVPVVDVHFLLSFAAKALRAVTIHSQNSYRRETDSRKIRGTVIEKGDTVSQFRCPRSSAYAVRESDQFPTFPTQPVAM